ncbi:MAG: hypothetical protein II135_11405 [Clostridia bacterium]|nr:hypothetical protein [Clostridia bacterium]MBQ3869001.1 hypothetical protein [Clostridia bacterium]
MKKRRVIYYSDERNDEFSGADIDPVKIDGSYKYEKDGFFARILGFFLYRIVALPIAFIYAKLFLCQKTVNKKALKECKDKGFFIYGNHTHKYGDPVMPNIFCFPKKLYFIVNPENVSMKILGKITPYLGALPLPSDMAAYRNFSIAVQKRIRDKHGIVIYPEAHIWPYYTGIRDFPDSSFTYPVKLDTPVYCFTNTYRKGVFGCARIVTYIDGPFCPDPSLSYKQRIKDLRDRVYRTMCKRSENSDYEKIEYIKKEN